MMDILCNLNLINLKYSFCLYKYVQWGKIIQIHEVIFVKMNIYSVQVEMLFYSH